VAPDVVGSRSFGRSATCRPSATGRCFDVCVVGSGAGGGMAAKVLTEAGAEVVMLEAGVMWDSARDAKMFGWSYDAGLREHD
jgi:choline dehydrogenase-like flavoprotein